MFERLLCVHIQCTIYINIYWYFITGETRNCFIVTSSSSFAVYSEASRGIGAQVYHCVSLRDIPREAEDVQGGRCVSWILDTILYANRSAAALCVLRCMCVRAYVCAYMCFLVCACMYLCVCVHVCPCECVSACVRACIHAFVSKHAMPINTIANITISFLSYCYLK